MSILSKLFGKSKSNESPEPEHAVLVKFMYGSTDLSGLYSLEEQLEEAIAQSSSGELDGNEMAADGSEGTLYLYGPNADSLFSSIRPVLEACPFMAGAQATLRYGPPEETTKEVLVEIGT